VTVSNRPKQNPAHPNVKVPPPLLALLYVALIYLLARLIPLPLAVPPVFEVMGFLLVVLGFLLGLAALITFRRANTTLNPRGRVSHLVTSGIYSFTRNPIYLGFLLIVIGISLDSGTYWGVILAPFLVILFNQWIIRPEEEYLSHKFGEQFLSYKQKVRRWI
jgi:protein-S-isoprenylcysteine O-methyltransferase Ste14